MATESEQLLSSIPVLVAQLRSSSRVGRASAAKALCALAAVPVCRSAVRAVDGIVPLLVARLGDSGATIQERTAVLLRMLVDESQATHAAALAAGAMPRLVALLGGSSSGSSGGRGSKGGGGRPAGSSSSISSSSEAVRVQAILATHELIKHVSNKTAAADAGCVPPLLRLLRGSSSPAQQEAAAALRNLAASGSCCVQAMLDAGAAQVLVDFLHSMEDYGSDAGSSSDGSSDRDGHCGSGTGSYSFSYSDSSSGEGEQEDAAGLIATVLAFMAKHGGPAAVDAVVLAAGSVQQLEELLLTHAEGCGATKGLRRCGGCGTVRYCGVACSKAHWPEHKAECRRLQAAAAAAAAGEPQAN
ncbi:histone lysine methyltransferase Set6 [Chlorella sorokiniana]|uniref:Histone lysine methyltransferase Set6 n=1 Tax=Chlorella sorokiniana TaxID=3076 RepID=A0A2P6TIW7_CHLSO|nr:histone lysine methyltransferase Set6 [Chlorella sorokiniana]|eukprot:PRW39186.1 histone lysine methyltransferase Set6 [Chlorella sorokiniana]